MRFKDKLAEIEERLSYFAEHIKVLDSVQRRPGIGELLQRHIRNSFSAIDDARMHGDEESARRAIDMADMFTTLAQTTGISDMRLVNKEMHKSRADASEKLARLDALTQSGNRLAFSEQIQSLRRQQDKDPSLHSAVMLFDLDRFKGLNDKYGHAAGDAGLRAFADKLKSITRQDDQRTLGNNQRSSRPASATDSLYTPVFEGKEPPSDAKLDQAEYRFGGDEFALTLQVRADTREDALAMFQAIENRIKANLAVFSFEHDGQVFPLVSSAGVHVLEENDTAVIACEKADRALFEHKNTKSLRYAESVQVLRDSGVENIAEVPDPRADEKKLLSQARIGAAVQSLQMAGDFRIIVPEGAEPDAVSTLREAGVSVSLENHDMAATPDPQ